MLNLEPSGYGFSVSTGRLPELLSENLKEDFASEAYTLSPTDRKPYTLK